MTDLLKSLTELALSAYRRASAEPHSLFDFIGTSAGDSVLNSASRAAGIASVPGAELDAFARALSAEPEFEALAYREGEHDPMVVHAGGGFRTSLQGLIGSLFASANIQTYFLGRANTESNFLRLVLEGFEELRRAVRGEKVRSIQITGYARIKLAKGAKIQTPWGHLYPAPEVRPEAMVFRPGASETSCILVEEILSEVRFDRSPNPPLLTEELTRLQRASLNASVLLPLSCALASNDTKSPAGPVSTWTTLLLPFQSGFGYSMPLLGPSLGPATDITGLVSEIDEWSRVVERAHSQTVDIAARRLVSAIGHRLDKADSLIDAVMVWENLVGTSNELTFRVTAALAKMLEPKPASRAEVRKKFANVYQVRSKLVHGVSVEQSDIHSACVDAIDVAIRAMRICYSRGGEWLSLSSNERAEAILLEWA